MFEVRAPGKVKRVDTSGVQVFLFVVGLPVDQLRVNREHSDYTHHYSTLEQC